MAQRFDSLLAERPEKRYEEFLKTVSALASAEGLFVRKGAE